MRCRGNLSGINYIPLGFSEFSDAWNAGARLDDPRRISEVHLSGGLDNAIVTTYNRPVHPSEFNISPEQVGIAEDKPDRPSAALQAEINHEFAAIMIAERKRQCRYFEQRQERRNNTFTMGTTNAIASPSSTTVRAKVVRRCN